jgi:hypothetical protein
MVVMPNTTIPVPQVTASVAVPTGTTPNTGIGGASVYYWQARVNVRAQITPSPTNTNGASALLGGASLKNSLMAAVATSALVLGSALLL